MPLTRLFFTLLVTIGLFSCDKAADTLMNHPLQAFENNIGEWNWLDVDGMICRDSSATGISVRLGSVPTKWAFYLQGGGACFTPSTCASNPSSFSSGDFFDREANGFYDGGILNNSKVENPVKDWNIVFIPYCTGDVHVGNREDGFPLGGDEKQQFVGSRNIRLALDFLKPYMDEKLIDELMITGISAGGFGTHIAFFEAKERFPNVKTHLINDSGPLISDPLIFPTCLTLGFQFLYNIPLPPGFPLCCTPSYGLANAYTLSARLYPTDNFGLIAHLEDNVIRFFFAAGQDGCAGGEVTGEEFKAGLIHLRENVLKPTEKWSTFYKTGESHTFIQGNTTFYESEVESQFLYQWVKDVMDGKIQHLEE